METLKYFDDYGDLVDSPFSAENNILYIVPQDGDRLLDAIAMMGRLPTDTQSALCWILPWCKTFSTGDYHGVYIGARAYGSSYQVVETYYGSCSACDTLKGILEDGTLEELFEFVNSIGNSILLMTAEEFIQWINRRCSNYSWDNDDKHEGYVFSPEEATEYMKQFFPKIVFPWEG